MLWLLSWLKLYLLIVKYCAACENCAECQLKDYCGKTFQSY